MLKASIQDDGVKITPFQVRVLFAQSGRVGIFSFASPNQAFTAFQDALMAWEGYKKVAFATVNGTTVFETDEVALISVFM